MIGIGQRDGGGYVEWHELDLALDLDVRKGESKNPLHFQVGLLVAPQIEK